MPKKKQPVSVYQLKVTLKESSPPIWRRIQVNSDISLYKLHQILQVVMGWLDYHLHQFVIHGEYYGVPEPDFDFEVKNEKRVKLNQVASRPGDKIVYEYDFGDSWEHVILLEKILEPEDRGHYPICLKGKRACPPEDCGGIWGYYDLLEAMQDPAHPEHDDILEWLESNFEPEEFDVDLVNKKLKTI
ncbi:MAG: plasmid pRiA4b ORF-3 family protein [Spirochaetota bacterium]|nr:plasmid pRiA4b ORF-3 family protein [Spirochaetota bacterium]